MKKFIKSFLCFALLTGALLGLQHVGLAADFRDTLEQIGDKTGLQNYDTNVHASASGRSGAKNITSAIFFVIDFVKYVLGSIAVLMLILKSVTMITAGKEAEDKITKEKNFLKYALMGLVLVFISEEAVKLAFFGEQGEVLRSEESAAEFATAGSQVLKGLYTFVQVLIGSIAVLMFIYSGFQMLVGASEEETVNNAKKRLFVSSIGLLVIGLSELIVKDIVFKDQGDTVDVARGRELLVDLTNFLSSVIGTVAVGAFVYAGFLYVLNFGNEDMTGKAKKIMFGAIVGMVLAAGAFALVSTVIEVQPAQ